MEGRLVGRTQEEENVKTKGEVRWRSSNVADVTGTTFISMANTFRNQRNRAIRRLLARKRLRGGRNSPESATSAQKSQNSYSVSLPTLRVARDATDGLIQDAHKRQGMASVYATMSVERSGTNNFRRCRLCGSSAKRGL